MFWDISIAEQLNTTPWDIRANMTTSDYFRLNEWNKAKSSGETGTVKMREMKAKMESKIAQGRAKKVDH